MRRIMGRNVLLMAVILLTAGCAFREKPVVSWSHLIEQVCAPESISDITLPCTEIFTSYDRTGGNNDYNNGFVKTGDGWLLLADLKGPGCLTRLWFTGIDGASRFRFVFDNEANARFEATCASFYDGSVGFPKEFISIDQCCFSSGFPIPYRQRLRIYVTDDGYSTGKGKLFFQLNAFRLRNCTVASAQFPVPAEVYAAAVAVKTRWTAFERAVRLPVVDRRFQLNGSGHTNIVNIDHGGTIQSLRIELDGWADMSFQKRSELLRRLWIRMSWDDSAVDSVRAPLGDFFGQMWDPKKVKSLYFTIDETGMECRFPMPFKKSARITLANLDNAPVSGRIIVVLAENAASPVGQGYFHCGWQSSSSQSRGQPHDVIKTDGRGRLAGCLLGVSSEDRSFWVLESDETMTKDKEKRPFWRGTGLEDYFNGGWYYRVVFQKPLFGLTMKRPFRTVQYRIHLQDVVTFNKGLSMSFERGPDNNSRAAYDSIVFYYLERPRPAFGLEPGESWANAPPDEFEANSLMTRLWDYERIPDFTNADKLLRYALERWKYPPETLALLNLRKLEYQARASGYNALAPQYRAIAQQTGAAAEAAKQLVQFHESGAALLGVYANKKTTIFLDGQPVLQTIDPQHTPVRTFDLAPGRHVLAVQTEAGEWPDWVQLCLKKGDRVIGIDSTWRCELNPQGAWTTLDYNDSRWRQDSSLVKGPPELEVVPFVMPDPYVGLQSQVEGVRVARSGRKPGDLLVLRKVIEIK